MGAPDPARETILSGNVPAMGGRGGGRDAAKRRRVLAMVVVFAMVLAVGATMLSILLT